jgi:LPXTG-motif cell wall-anchored protein
LISLAFQRFAPDILGREVPADPGSPGPWNGMTLLVILGFLLLALAVAFIAKIKRKDP